MCVIYVQFQVLLYQWQKDYLQNITCAACSTADVIFGTTMRTAAAVTLFKIAFGNILANRNIFASVCSLPLKNEIEADVFFEFVTIRAKIFFQRHF